MIQPQNHHKLAQIVQKIDPQGKLLHSWSLTGGISAQVAALEIERSNGETQKLVVRLHGDADLRHNLNIATDEFKLLTLLQAAGIPVPKPYSFDPSGEIFPTPYIILEYVEGATEFAPANLDDFLLQSAITLAQIHRIDAASPELAFLPQQANRQTEKLRQRPAQLDDSLDEGRIRDALEAIWPLTQTNPSALLHGDYWPGNLLWQNGKLAAVIDWEDAQVGDPLVDLGITRLEMMWWFGSEAMQRFTTDYQAHMPVLDFGNLPYWDLCAALRPSGRIADWAGDADTERKMRAGHRLFITQAFEKLSASR